MGETARQVEAAPEGTPEVIFTTVSIGLLREHPQNPRRHFDETSLKELADSIRTKGILTPLMVRAHGTNFQILAGARRFRAARAAGLEKVPVLIRELDDQSAFELILVDNLQRHDLHPLEEASGYQSLMRAGYDVARIAERVGRSIKYVYDRVKLLSLTKEAQKVFLDGTITAGHAILLARLTPADQKRALDLDARQPALLLLERTLFDPDHEDDEPVKPVSVREFASWIDEHVKFDRDQVDPMLFPETAASLAEAKEKADRLVPITHQYRASDEVREASKERIYGEQAWRRADGSSKSAKVCERSRLGIVVCGPGRGEAFRVCIDKERCGVHWADFQRAKKKRQAGRAQGEPAGEDRYTLEQKKLEEAHRQREARRKRWEKALPVILEAVAMSVKKAPARAKGLLAEIIISAVSRSKNGSELVPRGSTAEDLVRWVAFRILADEAGRWNAAEEFPKRARAFNIDVRKIIDHVAPPEKAQTSAEASTGKAKRKAC